MKYLLDVNALLAWCHARSQHNERFHKWAVKAGYQNLFTCAIVELGFLRLSMHVYGFNLGDAQAVLAQLKQKSGGFISDSPPPDLPAWANKAALTTDAYLCQLATAHKLQLATFDGGIKDPVAFLIS